MRDFSAVLVLFSAAAVIVMGGLIYFSRQALTSTREELKRTRASVSETRTQLNEIVLQKNQTDKTYQQLAAILSETSSFYPSLAQAIADFRALEGEKLAASLSRKSRPAYKSAQIARERDPRSVRTAPTPAASGIAGLVSSKSRRRALAARSKGGQKRHSHMRPLCYRYFYCLLRSQLRHKQVDAGA